MTKSSITARDSGPKKNPPDEDNQRDSYYLERERWQCALMMAPKLSAADKLVALTLLAHVNYKRFCATGGFVAYPSQETLGRILDRHETRIRDSLRSVIKRGVVEIEQKGGREGHRATRYRFRGDWLQEVECLLEPKLLSWPSSKRLKAFRGSGNATPKEVVPICRGSGTAIPGSPRGSGNARAGVAEPLGKSSDESIDSLTRERARPRRRPHDQGNRLSLKSNLEAFKPDEKLASWASENVPDVIDPCGKLHVGKFRDWHLSKGRYPRNLPAAFRNWLRKEQEYSTRDRRKAGRPNRLEEAWNDFNGKPGHA